MKKKKIIWAHTHFNYWMGGTKYIYEVISKLRKNYEIAVVLEDYSDFSSKKYDEIDASLYRINKISSNSIIYWLFFPINILTDLLNLKKILRTKGFNKNNTIIISSMFPMNFIATLLGYKHIQLCFEPFAFFYDKEFTKSFPILKQIFIRILSFLYSPLDQFSIKKAQGVLTLNSITKGLIKKRFDVGSELTQAGVNSNLFKPYVSDKIKNKYKGFSIAIHSTDFSPVKGTDRVIKAFSLTKKLEKKSKLLITSTIKNKAAQKILYDLASELGVGKDVLFLGFVPIDELPQLYSLANVLVQGSSSLDSGTTSMALPVKEAMCCETPAIRPNAGGEDVVDGKTGFLVNPENIDLLANKIAILLNNTDLSNKMGKAARKYIISRYTWDNTANVFIKNIELIVK